jgi:hypothetical protein
MQVRLEQMSFPGKKLAERCSRDRGRHLAGGRGSKMSRENRRQWTCDKASPVAAVMLHLRVRYVSKAAILTLRVPVVPIENRSPA